MTLDTKLHPDYGCMGYRELKPGESVKSSAEARAARKYLEYRKRKGPDHLNLRIIGDVVTRLEDK